MEKNKTRRQIEEILDKSENTIKKLIRQVLKKLNVKSSKEAVKKVNKLGIEKKRNKKGVENTSFFIIMGVIMAHSFEGILVLVLKITNFKPYNNQLRSGWQ